MLIAGTVALAHLRRAVAGYVHRAGPDAVPAALAELADALADAEFAAVRDQVSRPQVAIAVRFGGAIVEDATVSYETAARRLGVSKRTVARRVADGSLTRVGRRITVASLTRLENR